MQSGDRFAGRYLIEAQIGRGGMGVVYRARDERLGRKVALKVMAAELSRDAEFRARFDREASTAAAFEHPNVVHVYDYDEHDGVLYLVMRYVAGRDLRGELEVAGSFELVRAVAVVGQVAAGLDAAHAQGHVHRDVKPGNVLLERGAEGRERALLTDFGLAQPQEGGQGLTSSGKILGTASYMAPEQLLGQRASVRSDVYALACVAFECLSGRAPFRGTEGEIMQGHLNGGVPDLRLLVPGLPDEVALAVERGLSKQPGARPPGAGSFAGALADAAGRHGDPARTTVLNPVDLGPDETRPDDAPPRGAGGRRASRRPRAAAAAGVVLLALVGGAVVLYDGMRPDRSAADPPASAATSAPPSALPSLPATDPHRALISRLPADVYLGCARQREREGGSRLASLTCTPVDPRADELLVTQWSDKQAMLDAFWRSEGARPDSKCGAYAGTPTSGYRSTWGSDQGQRMSCYVNANGHAVLMWEYPDRAVQVAAINRDRAGSPLLFEWWQDAIRWPLQ